MNKIIAVAGVVIKEIYRRKDFYVLFILTALITLLMGSVTFFKGVSIARYLKEICLLLIWLSTLVIAITMTARQLPSEREQRTIFPLLAKPIGRWQVVLGKFWGCWLATGIALVVFYLFFGLISATRDHALPLARYSQALWLHWQMLGIVVAFTVLGSVLFTSPAENVTILLIITVGILLVGRHLNTVAMQVAGLPGSLLYALYYAIPHLEFYDVRDLIIHDWPLIAWTDIGLATIYGLAYSAFFLLAACLVFRRKALS